MEIVDAHHHFWDPAQATYLDGRQDSENSQKVAEHARIVRNTPRLDRPQSPD